MTALRSSRLNDVPRAEDQYLVGAVRKALEVLCHFTGDGASLGVSELARNLGIPKSTTHNLLRTLEAFDFLRQDPADRRYRLGPRVFELGVRFSRSTQLLSVAMPHLQRLAGDTKETVKLGVRSNHEVLIVAAVESPYELHTRGDEGVRAWLHSTGLGKAILARLPDREVRAVVAARGLPRFTPHTISTPPALEAELRSIRTDGYAIDREESELGVVCVASAIAAVHGGALAALSVSAPASRLGGDGLRACATKVLGAAHAVEAALGAPRRGLETGRAADRDRTNRETP